MSKAMKKRIRLSFIAMLILSLALIHIFNLSRSQTSPPTNQDTRNLKLTSFPPNKEPLWYSGRFPQTIPSITISKTLKPSSDVSKRVSIDRKGKESFYIGIAGISFFRIYFGNLLNESQLEFIEQFNSPYDVTALAFHPNGRFIASGHENGTIILREIKGYKTKKKLGSRIRTKKSHLGAVNALIFTPDGRYLISGGTDYSVRIWDLYAYQTKTLYSHKNIVSKVVVSPDGKYIASAGYDHQIILYDLQNRKIAMRSSNLDNQIKHTNWVSDLAFSPTNQSLKLVSVGYDRQVLLWDLNDLNNISVIKLGEHRTVIYGVAFSTNGLIATSGSDGRIILWKGNKKQNIIQVHDALVKNLFFAPKGKTLFSSSNKGVILLHTVK